jgi:hypothetical protein
VKFRIEELCENQYGKLKIPLKWDKNIGHINEELFTLHCYGDLKFGV